jgi:S-adenosylmethionine hydrolase
VPWVKSYGDVSEGEALIHVDSVGLLAVAVRGGRADDEMNLVEGVPVSLAASRSAKAE